DNLFGDSFPQNALVAKLKSCASHFECDGHDPLGLGFEFGTVQKLRDGHDPRRYLQWHLLCKSREGFYSSYIGGIIPEIHSIRQCADRLGRDDRGGTSASHTQASLANHSCSVRQIAQ